MKTTMLKAVEQYQCPGCINGLNPTDCSQAQVGASGCTTHRPGTNIPGVGTIALGLPNGFNRFGPAEAIAVTVYESFEKMIELHPNLKTKFSLPIWKYLDAEGNTIVRWFSPRTNAGWSMVILGDCRDQMPNALELSAAEIAHMA